MEGMMEWVNVNDRVPEIDQTVLMCQYEKGYDTWVAIGTRVGENEWRTTESQYMDATHWAVITEPTTDTDETMG